MPEVAALVALTVAGVGLLSPISRNIPRIALGALAFPLGAVAFAIVGAVQLVAIDRIAPVAALLTTLTIGGIVLTVAAVQGRFDRSSAFTGAVTIGVSALVATMAWFIPLTRLTIDSMRYIISAHDLQLTDGVTIVQPADLLKRQLGLPAWQSLASFTDRRYVAGVGPLFGISGTVLLGWLAWTVTSAVDLGRRRLLTVAAVAFALASNRFVYDWFYINTHVAMAVLVLIGVVGLWFATIRDIDDWAFPSGLALAGTLLLRAESALVVALVLVAFAPEIRSTTLRRSLIAPIVVVAVIWHGMTLWIHASGGSDIAFDAPVLMGLLALLGSALLVMIGGSRFSDVVRLARALLLPALATAVVIATALDPGITIDTIVATARNVGYQGLWMFTWTLGVPLLVVALVIQRFRGGRAWSVVVTGYGILFFLLPHLRGSPWRLGSGDSGNRILAHIVLVVIAFLVIAVVDDGDGTGVAAPSR